MLMYLASPFASAKLERKSFARTTEKENIIRQIYKKERNKAGEVDPTFVRVEVEVLHGSATRSTREREGQG